LQQGRLSRSVGTGTESRRWRRFGASRPDVAVLDINMPRMTGFELAQKIRERSRIP